MTKIKETEGENMVDKIPHRKNQESNNANPTKNREEIRRIVFIHAKLIKLDQTALFKQK